MLDCSACIKNIVLCNGLSVLQSALCASAKAPWSNGSNRKEVFLYELHFPPLKHRIYFRLAQ